MRQSDRFALHEECIKIGQHEWLIAGKIEPRSGFLAGCSPSKFVTSGARHTLRNTRSSNPATSPVRRKRFSSTQPSCCVISSSLAVAKLKPLEGIRRSARAEQTALCAINRANHRAADAAAEIQFHRRRSPRCSFSSKRPRRWRTIFSPHRRALLWLENRN